ncbi:hypothetical protein RYX36_001247 [Vicia faba]
MSRIFPVVELSYAIADCMALKLCTTWLTWTWGLVCEFAKLTHVQLLEETERAVGDPQLPEQHRTLIDKSRALKHVELSLEKNEGTLNQLKERNAELEKDVERGLYRKISGILKFPSIETDSEERAAKKILKLDPSNSDSTVMLSNIHASAGNWEAVAKLRNLMKQMGVQKILGQSWTKVKDEMHIFFSEDSSHPQRSNIYTMLEELWLQVLDDGYDPCHRLKISIW